MNRFKTLNVKDKLMLLISVYTVGFGVFALVAFQTLNDLKINGPYYKSIARGQEIYADVLPPPQFIVESYLGVLRCLIASNPEELNDIISRGHKQRLTYEARHAYWENDTLVNDKAVKDVLLLKAYTPAEKFFDVRDNEFFPAIQRAEEARKRGDIAGQNAALAQASALARGPLKTYYIQHREFTVPIIDRIETRQKDIETQAAEVVNERTFWLGVLGIMLVAISSVGAGLGLSRSISRSLTETISSLSSTSAEMAATVEQQERTAVLQSTAVHETTTTMDELDASFSQTAEMVKIAADTAQSAAMVANDGIETVRQTLDGMSRLKDKVTAVSEQISNLSEQTGQIGVITRAVSDLANQTNMLALNAAVEAARAGEHGKGFGVVAAEIRKLADESKKSAERINSLVEDIQKATDATVMATEEGSKTVDADIQLAQQTAHAFNGIVSSSNMALEAAQQTLLAVPQQVAAVRQVLSAMEELNRGAKETADGLGQTKISVENLQAAAHTLKAMV